MNSTFESPIQSNDVKMKVEDVKLGMFIADLDVDWSATQFMFKGFLLENKDQMIELLKHCQWVLVSRERSVPGIVPDSYQAGKPASSNNAHHVQPQQVTSFQHIADANEAVLHEARTNAFRVGKLLNPLSNMIESATSEFKQFMSDVTHRKTLKPNYDPNRIHKDESQAIKSDFIKVARAKQINLQFKGNVNENIVNHVSTSTIKDEVKKAVVAQGDLLDAASAALDHDMMGSSIHESIDIAKDAISEVVESISRNPEAIQLVSSIKKLDSESYQHAIDAALMMVAFGRELCLSKQDLVEVGLGGLLHDVGEIKPPENTQMIKRIKNITKFKIYKSHVEEGLKIIAGNNHSRIVTQIIENHHEYYDGSGYPKGRVKGQLGYHANMMVIVDSYLSLTTGRCCDVPLAPSRALSVMYHQKGKKFHPGMLDTFIQLIGLYPVGSKVRLSTGDVGYVIKQNKQRKLRPVVMVVLDKRGKKLEKPVHLDLMELINGKEISVAKELVIDNSELLAEAYF